MTQAVTAGVAFEVDFAFAKTTFKLEVTLTFSESWTTTVTEEKECSVPPYSTVYFYQGIMNAAIMRYDAKNLKFYYLPYANAGKYQADIIKATENPI